MFCKYPNPFCAHVITLDIIDRYVDSAGRLHTIRLFEKGSRFIPLWLLAIFKSKKAYMLEDSLVDPQCGEMSVYTRNISHRRLLTASESYSINRNGNHTDIQVTQMLKCSTKMLGLVASQIEAFGASKFAENLARSRQALLYILDKLPAPPSRRL